MDKAPTKEAVPTKSNPNEQKNAANLKKALAQSLISFEKVKEWADYGHWLLKVGKHLEDYPSYQIPEKLTFAKRLAQCLNPNLPPAIHQNAIQVYSLIFRNMRNGGYNWCDDLGLYSIGVFPIFQYASFQLKPKILAFFRDNYFPLGKQLIPCITGLVVSILPGLEEQNEKLQKDVFATLDQLSDSVTKRYFIGAVWMAVLRSPKVKVAGMKYLSKRLKKTYVDTEEQQDDNKSDSDEEEISKKGSPEKAVVEELEENPEALELPNQEELPQEEKEEKEISTTTKEEVKEDFTIVEDAYENYQPSAEDEAFLRSLDQQDDDDLVVEYPNKSSLVINALISSLEDENVATQKMVLDFMYTHFKLASPVFDDSEKCILIESALHLLMKKDQQILRRVYTWLFGPADMDNKYQVTEKNEYVLNYLIQAFIQLFNRVPKDNIAATLPLKVLQNFYMEHDHLVEQTLPYLAIPFLSFIAKYSAPGAEFAEEVHKSGARFMENITSFFSLLLTSLSESLEKEIQRQDTEECLKIINLIEFTFKLEAAITNKEENLNYFEQKDYLTAIISGILRSTSSISPDQENLIPFIETALSLNLTLIDKLEKVEKDWEDLIASKKLSEAELAKIVPPHQSDHGLLETLGLFNTFYDRLVQTVLGFHHEGQITHKFLNFLSLASETVVKVQVFQENAELSQIPSWIYSVFECIKSPFPSVSIVGIKMIQSLLISNPKHAVYESIRQMITSDESKGSSSDIVRRTNEKLWSLLDVHYIQNTVAELLTTFQIHFPQIFQETVANSFSGKSITDKEAAIRRFSSFWKLSSDMGKGNSFIESGTGLFRMLDFLDNHNPLLRHSTKSWLLESVPFLFRIVDPIFESLMQCNDHHSLKLYVTDSKQYFFTEVYDTEFTQSAFRKLRSILIASGELFIKYITAIKLSERLKHYTTFYTDNEVEDVDNCTYFDLLITLCLRYIQGHAIEALSPKFQNQNSSVNASASEFMEILIGYIENNKELSAKTTHFIMEPLLIVLSHSLHNNDYVLQVQLINLLKVILFQSSFCSNPATKARCEELLASLRFVPNLLKGLQVNQPYVRIQFINFIGLCVGVLTDNLSKKEVLTSSVLSILKAYFNIILSKGLDKSEKNDEFDPWEVDMMITHEDDSKRKVVAGSEVNSPEVKNKASRNMFALRQQNQNEIYILLEGVRMILDYFLKFNVKLAEAAEVKDPNEGAGMMSSVKSILTLGLLKAHTEVKKDFLATAQHADTAKALLGDLYRVVFIFIYSWRLSKEFRQTADFTSAGISAYSFERFNEINKMIKECQMKVDIHTKNVKSLIILVLKCLMAQYPKETFSSFLSYWVKECDKSDRGDGLNFNPNMMKEMEILVSMKVSLDTFFDALSKNQIVMDLTAYYQRKQKEGKRAPAILEYDIVKIENQIFFFLYTFLAYSYIDISFLKKDYLFRLWTTVLNFTKIFSATKSTATQLWILELFQLLALKYNPKEVLGDHKLKKEMHAQINALLVALANTSAKNGVIYFNHPSGGGDADSYFKTILPFPPTIYELYKNYVKNQKTGKTSRSESQFSQISPISIHQQKINELLESVEIEKLMFNEFRTDITEQGLLNRYRLFAFKTLKQIGLTVIQNSYSPEKVDRIITRTKEWTSLLFPILQNKSPENQPFLECASELLYSQLESSRSFLLKDYRKDIIDLFNENDFFKCSKQTLKYWSSIIDWAMSMDRGDIFSEFLTKVSAFSFLWSKDSETKMKIKSFERICFIIYSGEQDKYQEKLLVLLEKMGDVIKNADSSHPSLLILVLFCFRILILRLSPSALTELFRHIWPILLTLLMQIFNKKGTVPKNPNLTLAALKLIEMMSIVQLEEFYINQWVFIFDYFGLKFEQKESNQQIQEVTETEDAVVVESKPQISGFIYQPYVTNTLKDDLYLDYKNKALEAQENGETMERKVVLTMTNVDDESEIKELARELVQYLILQNELTMQVSPEQIESLIEGDFISLDDYIFNLN